MYQRTTRCACETAGVGRSSGPCVNGAITNMMVVKIPQPISTDYADRPSISTLIALTSSPVSPHGARRCVHAPALSVGGPSSHLVGSLVPRDRVPGTSLGAARWEGAVTAPPPREHRRGTTRDLQAVGRSTGKWRVV